MEHLITPAGYKPVLDLRETQVAIKEIKDFFQRELAKQLNLTTITETEPASCFCSCFRKPVIRSER